MGAEDDDSEEGGDEWQNRRLEVTHGEARAVIEAQNETMTDIDDKAMRTVRLTAALIGVLVAAIQFAPAIFHDGFLLAGIVLLIISMIVGIVTYDESNLYLGPRGEYIEALSADAFADDHWDQDLLETFAGMIAENYDDIQWNARLLRWSLRLLISGLVVAVASILI